MDYNYCAPCVPEVTHGNNDRGVIAVRYLVPKRPARLSTRCAAAEIVPRGPPKVPNKLTALKLLSSTLGHPPFLPGSSQSAGLYGLNCYGM